MVERGEEEPENPRRSIRSNVKVPIRFKNRTGRRVKVVWLNYQGEEVPYATLEMSSCPSSELGEEQPISQLAYYTVDTFVTHPWIAVDEESNKRMLLNSQDIYFPSPPQVRRMDYERRVAIVVRTDVVITLPVYTLEEYCCQTVQKLVSKEDITRLPLPPVILNKLAETP